MSLATQGSPVSWSIETTVALVPPTVHTTDLPFWDSSWTGGSAFSIACASELSSAFAESTAGAAPGVASAAWPAWARPAGRRR